MDDHDEDSQHSDTDPITTEALLRCFATMLAGPLRRAWPKDHDGKSTLLKLPKDFDLAYGQKQQRGLYDSSRSLANLPPELQCLIFAQLPLIDRVCLALTCKSLASSALASQQLRITSWTPWVYCPAEQIPSRQLLILRLAHGWVNKADHRYCTKCTKILPRSPQYFYEKLKKRKRLPWDVKVRMNREDWHKLSTRRRRQHIVDTWCKSTQEDASVYACDECRVREIAGRHRDDQNRDLEKGEAEHPNIAESPVECPTCVIRSITETYKEPHKPKIRPKLWKWTKKTLGFFGNTILVLMYVVYLLLKTPFDLGMWLHRKYKQRSQPGERKWFWCT